MLAIMMCRLVNKSRFVVWTYFYIKRRNASRRVAGFNSIVTSNCDANLERGPMACIEFNQIYFVPSNVASHAPMTANIIDHFVASSRLLPTTVCIVTVNVRVLVVYMRTGCCMAYGSAFVRVVGCVRHACVWIAEGCDMQTMRRMRTMSAFAYDDDNDDNRNCG